MSTSPLTSPLTSAATSADQYVTALRDGWAQAMQQWVDQSSSAWDQWSRWSQDWSGRPHDPQRPHPRDRRHDHGPDHCRDHPHGHREPACGDRCSDGCRCCGDACTCCAPEAEVIVHARAGETRVVPFRLSNHWRREREVTLAVGPWQVCGGRGLEVSAALEEEKLVLAPCEDRVVTLLMSVQASGDDPVQSTDTAPTAADLTAAPTAMTQGRRGGDVDACVSAYADVRFEGCGRPVRVAVVVSPRHCDAVDICCDCGCCC